MHLSRSLFTLIVPLVAALGVAAQAQTAPPSPNVSLAFDSPAYSYAASCDLTKPLAFLSVIATNNDSFSGPFAIVAVDQSGVLTGGYSVPVLAPGASTAIRIPLTRAGSTRASAIAGDHAISVFVRGRPARLELSLPFSATWCSPNSSAVLSDTVTPYSRKTSATTAAILASVTIAVPVNVRGVASGPDCAAHVGVVGAFVCPDLIRSGDLLLIWDWQPGNGPGEIDGYRVYSGDGYRTNVPGYVGQLVGTRPNKELTLFDVPKPRDAPSLVRCYVITAYAGSKESRPSAPFCGSGEKTSRLQH